MVKKFRCKKAFSIPCYDEDGNQIQGKEFYVETGQVYTLDESGSTLLSVDIHLDSENGYWIEISKQRLKECFEKIN